MYFDRREPKVNNSPYKHRLCDNEVIIGKIRSGNMLTLKELAMENLIYDNCLHVLENYISYIQSIHIVSKNTCIYGVLHKVY